jgi:hypothetical protein
MKKKLGIYVIIVGMIFVLIGILIKLNNPTGALHTVIIVPALLIELVGIYLLITDFIKQRSVKS